MIVDSDYDSLPTFAVFKEQLEKLKQIHLENPSIEEIQNTYYSIMPFLPRMLSRIHFNENRHLPFYIVRLNIDPDKEDIGLIRTYSYPSVNFCTDNGRANRHGKTVFYCSNKAFAAVFESKPKVGDTGYLSVWENNITKPLNAAVYLPKHFDNPNEWQQVANSAHLFAESYFKENGRDKFEHFLAMNDFMADRFLREHYPYALSSFVSNEALFGPNAKDLVLYPSVASNSHYCNFAIHPNVVDRYLTFQKVIRFKVITFDSELRFQYSTGKIGEIINNNIIWRNANLGEVDFNELP